MAIRRTVFWKVGGSLDAQPTCQLQPSLLPFSPQPSSVTYPDLLSSLLFIVGRSVTRMRKNCGELYEQHWQCLERHNQKLYPCRLAERRMNECVFDKMVRLPLFFFFAFLRVRSLLGIGPLPPRPFL